MKRWTPSLTLVGIASLLGAIALLPYPAETRRAHAADGAEPGPVASQGQDKAYTKAKEAPAKGAGYGKGAGYDQYPDGPYTDRSKLPDSFKYYGPNGLWYTWSKDQRLGRDTWIFSTYGNQKFYRILARFGGELGLSIDFYRLLDGRKRKDRFKDLGLINEPNFQGGDYKNEWGFHMDKPLGDPIPEAYPVDEKWYGKPTGIVGLRLFPNPAFTAAMAADWKMDPEGSVRRYFKSPGKVEPPQLVGLTCAFCHIAFDPLNPPKDPAAPRWENLAANIGNQYLREGDLFFGKGRIVAGDANPTNPTNPDADPYATEGLKENSFLYQYGHTQLPGTSETSRFSYDFINNPNTINQIFNIGNRALFHETTNDDVKVLTTHVLKDGADSIGLLGALLRVPINIGAEGDYWVDRLWNPVTGQKQSPFDLREVKLQVSPERKQELLAKYPELGEAWRENEKRAPAMAAYLASYTPFYLAEAKGPDGKPGHYVSKDPEQLKRGALLFADQCASCHSNKQPFYPLKTEEEKKQFFRRLVLSSDFRVGNTYADDVRYPFNAPGFGINAARALATNAIDGDIWADFSSADYKALPALRFMKFENPLGQIAGGKYGNAPIVTSFVAPGGGRGYYRTAALNSMWTSAPFLHNNAVGRSPVAANGDLDAKAITIEGRIALFEYAMDQLLTPSKRPNLIKVTSADSTVTEGMPMLKARLASMIRDIAKEKVHEAFAKVVAEVVAKSELPDELKPAAGLAISDLVERLAPEVERLYSAETVKQTKASIIKEVRAQIDAMIAQKLQNRPKLAALFTQLKPDLEAAIQSQVKDLTDLFDPELRIPKGTPVNLLMNLNIAKAPYALKAYLRLKNQPRALAEALLNLSDCPDLVEDRGHTYGSDLGKDEKRDLIEFLKNL